MYKLKFLLVVTIYIVNIYVTKAALKDNFCYIPKFMETSWTDRRPEFKVNMTFSNQGFIRSLNWIERDIISPVARMVVMQKDYDGKTSTIYNLTTRLCDIPQFIDKLPMFKGTISKALKQGNYTYECPLKRGFYVMDNIRVNSRNPVLALLYRPNRILTFSGGLYEELANKSLVRLTTYRFSGKLSKKVCKDF